jgi:hypothetical protein
MIQKGLVALMVILVAFSCSKKETTPPTAGETNSLLLAGAKGSSFSWKITGIQGSEFREVLLGAHHRIYNS